MYFTICIYIYTFEHLLGTKQHTKNKYIIHLLVVLLLADTPLTVTVWLQTKRKITLVKIFCFVNNLYSPDQIESVL